MSWLYTDTDYITKQRFAFSATWNICIHLNLQDSRQLKKNNPLSIIFTTWAVRLVIKLNKSKIGVQSLYWSICFNTLYACLKAAGLYGGLLAYWHFKTVFPLINNRHRLWAPDQENKTVMGFILDLLMVEGKTGGGKAKEGVKWLSYPLRWLGKRRQDMWQDEGE